MNPFFEGFLYALWLGWRLAKAVLIGAAVMSLAFVSYLLLFKGALWLGDFLKGLE